MLHSGQKRDEMKKRKNGPTVPKREVMKKIQDKETLSCFIPVIYFVKDAQTKTKMSEQKLITSRKLQQ